MKKRALPDYFFDLEALEWDRVILACVVEQDGTEHTFEGASSLRQLADFMEDHPGRYFGHYAGGYDTPLLMNVKGFPEIILTGTNILCARDGDLSVHDTFPLWLASLKAVGDAVGLPKLDVDRGDIGSLSMDDLKRYCLRDTHIVRCGKQETDAFMDAHDARRRKTSGACAVELVHALEPGSWKALISNRCSVEDVMSFLDDAAGRGGRTEHFTRGIVEGVTSVDFKSSYPARYIDKDVGIGLREADSSDPADDVIGLYEWFWPYRDKIPPATDFGTTCGYGPASAWLVGEEVQLFRRAGVEPKRIRGWAPLEKFPVGQTFAKVMYAAKEGAGAARFFSKVFFNAWIGKTLEHPVKEHFTAWRPGEGQYVEALGLEVVGDRERRPDASWFRYSTIEHAADGKCEPYMQPALGERVLGRARAALCEEAFWRLQAAGIPVLYCDTDSCHAKASKERVEEVLGDSIGTAIGKLAVEATACTGYYLGPKAYLLVDESGKANKKKDGSYFDRGDIVKSALKGIPLRSYAKGTIDADGIFREARKGESARDVRIKIFEEALRGREARCLKDGVSTFLRGAHGYERETGRDGDGKKILERTRSFWGRAPQVRKVRCSGRGKGFFEPTPGEPSPFRYVSALESAGLDLLRKVRELSLSSSRKGMSKKRWESHPYSARAWLVDERAVVIVEEARGEAIGERGAAWKRLVQENGLDGHDRATGLEGWLLAGLSSPPSSHEQGFRRATAKMRSWRDVERLLPAIREALDTQSVILPDSFDASYRVEYDPQGGARLLAEAGETGAREERT